MNCAISRIFLASFLLDVAKVFADETVRATGDERGFEITCEMDPYYPNGSGSASGDTIKLIHDGESVAESKSGRLIHRTNNTDSVYGSYQCILVDSRTPSVTVLKTTSLLPPNKIFSWSSTRGVVRVKVGQPVTLSCSAPHGDVPPKGVIKLLRGRRGTLVAQAKYPEELGITTSIIPAPADPSIFRCVRSKVGSDEVPGGGVYPLRDYTFVLKTNVLVYTYVRFDEVSSRVLGYNQNIAVYGVSSDTIWTFGAQRLVLPSLRLRNVQVVDGVLYITDSSVKNTGSYTAVMSDELYKISLHFSNENQAEIPISSALDSSDDAFEFSDYQSDIDINPSSPAYSPPDNARNVIRPCVRNPPRDTGYSRNFADTQLLRNAWNDNQESTGPKVYRTDLSSAFSYVCEGLGEGIMSLHFEKDGMQIPVSNIQRVSSSRMKAVLEIPAVQLSDAGNYVCVMDFFSPTSSEPVTKKLYFTLLVDQK